jgi:hypothetical protein
MLVPVSECERMRLGGVGADANLSVNMQSTSFLVRSSPAVCALKQCVHMLMFAKGCKQAWSAKLCGL